MWTATNLVDNRDSFGERVVVVATKHFRIMALRGTLKVAM